METLTHTILQSYPVHRLCLSSRWRMHIFHWSYYKWLHSGTSIAADSLLHKTQQGTLRKTTQKQTSCDLFFTCCTGDHFSLMYKLTFCAVGSGPARRACTLPTGRVADAIVTAATVSVTSFPIETSWARCHVRDKQYHYLLLNPADQKWKFQYLVNNTGFCMGNIRLVLSHVWPGWAFPNNSETKRAFVLLWFSVWKVSSLHMKHQQIQRYKQAESLISPFSFLQHWTASVKLNESLWCTCYSLRLQNGPIQPAGQEQTPLTWSHVAPFWHKHFSWQSKP